MTDLSLEASRSFWHDYPDSMIYRVIMFMEGVENWTLDGHPDVEKALAELGKVLEDVSKLDLDKLNFKDTLIQFCGHLKSSRVLRILQAFDVAHPGAAAKILVHAEETSQTVDDAPGLFLRRNVIFERLRLLSRVFSQERMSFISKALEGEHA